MCKNMERYSIKRALVGKDAHTPLGIVDSHVRLTKRAALKTKADAVREGLDIDDCTIMQACAMAQNLLHVHHGATPAAGLLGYTPHDNYNSESTTIQAHSTALDRHPDWAEATTRCRMKAKDNIIRGMIEERLAVANDIRSHKVDLDEITVGTDVDLWRTPGKKGQ